MLNVVKNTEDAAKRGGWMIMEITLLIMEKSWSFVFEFLWEPCKEIAG